MTADLVPGCYSCDIQAMERIPAREDVVHTDHWRAALAFNSTLPGWLVVVPARHVTSYAELSEEAAAELGGLLHRLSRALEEVTGCVKVYLMQFAEAEGYSHLHVHVVPRAADHPPEAKGPRVFSFLADDEADWFTESDRDALAARIRAALP
ncbi:HIT domain-containing protein [Flexivirga sp. ID2601S]|uniref:HIT domain-containing protein n=1 Tax=Flexivirga aerilata TaxID=1656889 RepID=A0A849ALH7_9MICO|nr:HIT domain-containing protein [Flexivirga aerilata]NNG40376.1 HIT domain-containing protein [Flexivirga aerilata]